MWNLRCICFVAALLLSWTANAHHGSSGQFDTRASVELSGKITRVRLVNPHAYVYFDSTNERGDVVNMRCELQSGSLLKRRGWTKELFETGSHIVIKGSPDRTDPTTCYMQEITFENGVTAHRDSEFDENGTLIHSHQHDEDIKKERAERAVIREDGAPNLAGNWVMIRKKGQRPGGGGGRALLTEAGKLAVKDATAAQNPRYQCKPTNIIMDWWFDLMVNKIEQTDTKITLTYGFMSLKRTIYLDGTPMPIDYQPNRAGFSTGEWQGNTLVVTTTGFDEGWIMAPIDGNPGGMPPRGKDNNDNRPPPPSDLPPSDLSERTAPPKNGRPGPPSPAKNSSQLTIVERFTLSDDGTVLTREYTIRDPLYLEAPMTGSDQVTLTQAGYQPYECEDLTAERGSDSLGGLGVTKQSTASPRTSSSTLLITLEDSWLGTMVASTQWGYPIVLSLHAIGMATMVGIALMICIRVVGFAPSIPLNAMTPYWHVALIGFVINLFSGTALFLGNAVELYYNWAFRIKLLLVVIGLIITWQLVRSCTKQTNYNGDGLRPLALLALLSWIGAIVAGRLIGYMG